MLVMVVEAGEADALLPQLEELSSLLGEALLERGYAPEQVTVTIGTAGGACDKYTIVRSGMQGERGGPP